MAGKGVKKRPTLEELQAEVKAIADRIDAVHDRANSMERAARLMKEALKAMLGVPIVADNVYAGVLDRARKAVEFANQVGVP